MSVGILRGGEAGCTLVWRRSFLVWFENISGDLSSRLPAGWGRCLFVGVGVWTPYE